jgi:hypothetical protein
MKVSLISLTHLEVCAMRFISFIFEVSFIPLRLTSKNALCERLNGPKYIEVFLMFLFGPLLSFWKLSMLLACFCAVHTE